EHAEAQALYERYQREAPSPPERYQIKLRRFLQEHHERSLREYEDRLSKGGGGTSLLLTIAGSHLYLGHLEAALDAYDRHRAEAPDAPFADNERRRQGYEELVRRLGAGKEPALVLLLGRAHFGLDRLDPAGASYRRYQQEAPSPPEAYRARMKRY